VKLTLEPRTLPGTIGTFSVGYAVWQPLAHLLLHGVFHEPLAFHTVAESARFAVVCACLGAVAGALWYHGARRSAESRLHAWIKATVAMFAMTLMLRSDRFPVEPLPMWLFVSVFTAVVSGTLLYPLLRWSERSTSKRQLRLPSAAEPAGAGDFGPSIRGNTEGGAARRP
jgi:hypothetical protein